MEPKSQDFPTPGRYILALLEQRGWDQRTLAHVMGLSYAATNRLVLDKKPIDGYTALVLGEVFGVDPDNFLGLRSKLDLAVARASAMPDRGRAIRAALYGSLPIAELIRRGWLPGVIDYKQTEKVERAVASLFRVGSVESIPSLPHAAKKADALSEATPSQLAWLYRVREIAEILQVPRYSPAAVREALEKMESDLSTIDGVRRASKLLRDAGIRLVVVEALVGSKIDGVCTWLNDMAPVIGLTLRHDRIDNFWFVLRHECEHVLAGHGRRQARIDIEIAERQGDRLAEEERIANAAASDFCVPKESMDSFYLRKHPYFIKEDVLGFAASVKRHPGLVVGQLHQRSHRFDRFREYLQKVRDVVVPTVALDGWGAVFPITSRGSDEQEWMDAARA